MRRARRAQSAERSDHELIEPASQQPHAQRLPDCAADACGQHGDRTTAVEESESGACYGNRSRYRGYRAQRWCALQYVELGVDLLGGRTMRYLSRQAVQRADPVRIDAKGCHSLNRSEALSRLVNGHRYGVEAQGGDGMIEPHGRRKLLDPFSRAKTDVARAQHQRTEARQGSGCRFQVDGPNGWCGLR
jgi:hypothetical protein